MDGSLRSPLVESPESHPAGSTPHVEQSGSCIMCRRLFSEYVEMVEGYEAPSICNDCKAVLLDDIRISMQHSQIRRQYRGRSRRRLSSESIEDVLLQHFPQFIHYVRQNQNSSVSASESGFRVANLNSDTMSTESTRHRTQERRGRRQRASSDNEGETFDRDSIVSESDTNVSISVHGTFLGDSDVSVSHYGVDSDASLDAQSLADESIFINRNDDSDTDIDPMRAGLATWDSDDEDEEEDEEDGEWEEAVVEEVVEPGEPDNWVRVTEDSLTHIVWRPLGDPVADLEAEHSGGHEDDRVEVHPYVSNIFTNMEERDLERFVGGSGDYLDDREFEELLERLFDVDGLLRGAPPASASVIANLPRVSITQAHEEDGDLICAVCKDPLLVGTDANQLPCMHLYHPCCILPWLKARNSCPVCRFQLPTDDKDYEDGKRTGSSRLAFNLVHEQHPSDESYQTSDDEEIESSSGRWQHLTDAVENLPDDEVENQDRVDEIANTADSTACGSSNDSDRGSGGGWFLSAAAPIVGVMGVVLVLWLGNPLIGGGIHQGIGRQQQQQLLQRPGNSASFGRACRNRRWWNFF